MKDIAVRNDPAVDALEPATSSPPKPSLLDLTRTVVGGLALLLLGVGELFLIRVGGEDILLYYYELFIVVLVPLEAAAAIRRSRPSLSLVALVPALLVALIVVSAALHAGVEGWMTAGRVLGAVAMGHLILTAERPMLVRILTCALLGAVAQGVIALGQAIVEGPIGVPDLGEEASLVYVRSGEPSVQGTFYHPYLLAGFAFLGSSIGVYLLRYARTAAVRCCLFGAVFVAALPIGVTFSRMSVVSVAVIVPLAVTAFKRDRMLGAGLVVLLTGVVAIAAFNIDGWRDRASTTVAPEDAVEGQSSLDAATSSRVTFLGQAWRLILRNPVAGVGPARYSEALQNDPEARGRGPVYPVHNVPILVGAEAGVLAGILVILLLSLASARAVGHPWHLAVFLPFLVFFLLDHFPYSHGQGLGMTALWLGTVLRSNRDLRP